MAGKSTYIRQVALIVIMAQMGSFVPAAEAEIGVVDRVFTRVGAGDDIARGRSTFMVEMQETANILNNATPRSLIVLDEIGRGTSTFDGISIAWSVAEYLHNHAEVKAKTLFATHYHELTDIALAFPGVKNYNVLVSEKDDRIVFLRKIVPGAADKSYGIQVARLAGLPPDVIARAKEILANLEEGELGETGQPKLAQARPRKPKPGPTSSPSSGPDRPPHDQNPQTQRPHIVAGFVLPQTVWAEGGEGSRAGAEIFRTRAPAGPAAARRHRGHPRVGGRPAHTGDERGAHPVPRRPCRRPRRPVRSRQIRRPCRRASRRNLARPRPRPGRVRLRRPRLHRRQE
jgi:hypothetical protein